MKEHLTNNFSWVCCPQWATIKITNPPDNSLKTGNLKDGTQFWTAVANTPYGPIPGKAKDNNCWYPYGGNEVNTNDFSYVVSVDYELVKSANTPTTAIAAGNQTGEDGLGKLWIAVAHTDFGDIPGKAMGSTCWWSFNGGEYTTQEFSWVCARGWKLFLGERPKSVLPVGKQGDTVFYPIVAHTQYGDIPGKADDKNAWYPYNGLEYTIDKYSWVCYS